MQPGIISQTIAERRRGINDILAQPLKERQNVLQAYMYNDHTRTESYGLQARTEFSGVLLFLQTELCQSLPSR